MGFESRSGLILLLLLLPAAAGVLTAGAAGDATPPAAATAGDTAGLALTVRLLVLAGWLLANGPATAAGTGGNPACPDVAAAAVAAGCCDCPCIGAVALGAREEVFAGTGAAAGAAAGVPSAVQKPVMAVPSVATLMSLDGMPLGDWKKPAARMCNLQQHKYKCLQPSHAAAERQAGFYCPAGLRVQLPSNTLHIC